MIEFSWDELSLIAEACGYAIERFPGASVDFKDLLEKVETYADQEIQNEDSND